MVMSFRKFEAREIDLGPLAEIRCPG